MIRRPLELGLTLVEILVAIVLLGTVLVPAIRALQTGMAGADVHADLASNHLRVTSRLEELLAEPYSVLEASATNAGGPTVESSYSDPAGSPGRLLVFLSLYDVDNADADSNPFTGGEPELLWIRVEAEGTVHAVQTICARGY